MTHQSKSLRIKNGKVLLANGKIESVVLSIVNSKIAEIGSLAKPEQNVETIHADGAYVLPGFIDIHTHGVGYESWSGSLKAHAEFEAAQGTTTFYPTCFSSYEQIAEHMMRHVKETNDLHDVPQIGGFRLECPYLTVPGGGKAENLVPINPKITDKLLKAGNGHIKIWDISPELPSAPETIRLLSNSGVICSIAHTRATPQQARSAVDAGAQLVTHLFDTFAVPQMSDHGVYPAGLIDYLLIEDRLTCEIIPDGTHVPPMLVEKTFRCKPDNRVVFVTDSNFGAGLPAGDYEMPVGGGRIRITDPNNGVRLIDRDMGLCGSAMTPIHGFRNAIRLFGRDIASASRLCSKNQAQLLDLNKGEITVGKDADLVMLDADFEVLYTIVAGSVIFRKSETVDENP